MWSQRGRQTDLRESVNEQFAGTLRTQTLRLQNENKITVKSQLPENESKGGQPLLTQGRDYVYVYMYIYI